MRSATGHLRRFALALTAVAVAANASAETPSRTLFLVVDAVPYGLLEDLTDPARPGGPLFAEFHRPVPLISTFPSTTSIAMGAAFEPLGLERSPGYEARFFDRQRGKVRGGGPFSYFQIDFPWRNFFDWSSKGVVRSAVAGLHAPKASGRRMERVVRDFLASDDPYFFAYIETTDTAAHLKSPKSLERAFSRLDAALREARRSHPAAQYRVVVFSDHGIAGGRPLVNVWPAIRRQLEAAGLRRAKRLRQPNDVVFTPFGLVSSLEAYTFPERRAELAELIAQVDGVSLCVIEGDEPGRWVLTNRDGTAEIHRRRDSGGLVWSYRPVTADPLDYRPVVADLRLRRGDQQTEWFPDPWWFQATADHSRPDALARLAQGFELVTNPASVICSLSPEHMFGARRTERLAKWTQGRLEWTHGALDWEASAGFLMTDDPAFEPRGPMRISQGLEPFFGADGVAVASRPSADLRADPRAAKSR